MIGPTGSLEGGNGNANGNGNGNGNGNSTNGNNGGGGGSGSNGGGITTVNTPVGPTAPPAQFEGKAVANSAGFALLALGAFVVYFF
jgi:hypothetical protein